MKFSIGDPVYVKSNDEEGRIEEFVGKDMASVRVGKGCYHVYLEDLEHPYLRWFTQKKPQQKKNIYIDQIHSEKKVARQSNLAMGVYLAFVPIYVDDGFDEKVEKIKIYFYNEMPSDYHFTYDVKLKNELIFTFESDISAESEFYLHDLDFESAASNPYFLFRFIDKNDEKLDVEFSINIKPKKLFEYLDEIKFANRAIFHVKLFNKIEPKKREEVHLPKGKLSSTKSQQPSSHFNFSETFAKSTYEIDLHIEKLTPDFKTLSPSEMLYMQLKACQNALDLAIATHQSSIIIIHGVGKGKLKNEIHLILNQTNFIKEYVYDYDVRYGYGATKVFFAY